MNRLCHLCNLKLWNFQSFLHCSGYCDKNIHLACVKQFTESYLSDRDILLRTDDSSKHGLTFKCKDCTNLDDGDQSSPLNMSIVNDTNNSQNNIYMLEILNLVKTLYSEVKILRSDNNELKRELNEIKCALPSGTAVLAKQASGNGAKTRDPYIHLSNEKVPDPLRSTINKAELASTSSQGEMIANADPHGQIHVASDDFTLVTSKRKSRAVPPLHGSKRSDALKVASRTAPKKELFVSRLDPSTTAQDLESFLLNDLKLKTVKITKLKTKYQTYASFHLLIDSSDFNKAHHEDVWPEGILIKPFLGKVKSSEPKNEINQGGAVC